MDGMLEKEGRGRLARSTGTVAAASRLQFFEFC
jgi:hypothetical protein